MTTTTVTASSSVGESSSATTFASSPVITLAGRVLLTFIFIMAGLGHFAKPAIDAAAAAGVPLPGLAVPLSGVLAIVGGLSVLLGYHARIGAALLIAFLVPVTIMMHPFWATPDPLMHQIHQVMLLKNVSIAGGVLLILAFGAGPLSVDARRHARHS